MADQNRSSNGFLPFLMGVGVMAIAAGGWYFFTQQRSNAPTVSPVPTTAPPQIAATQAPESSPPAVVSSLPAAPSVNLQVNHPNGSTARLTQLAFNEDNITATLAVTNGHKEAIKLNNSEDFVITDNLGNQYNLAAPPDNPEINIAPGTTLKGQFVFKGRLAPNATSITLTTNKRFGSDASFRDNPKMIINVPLQGGAK